MRLKEGNYMDKRTHFAVVARLKEAERHLETAERIEGEPLEALRKREWHHVQAITCLASAIASLNNKKDSEGME